MRNNSFGYLDNQFSNNRLGGNRGFTVGGLLALVGLVGVLIMCLFVVKMRSVAGTELGVLETWGDGVVEKPYQPGMHFLFPGWSKTLYTYPMGMQVLVFNDKPDSQERVAEGRRDDVYLVQSSDQQDMRISFRLQWRRNPATIVDLHKVARDQVEERIIRTPLLNIVKNQATTRTALEAYSGAGLVKLQNDILKELHESPDLKKYVIVEGFVIEHIGLDKKYTNEIVERQVAVQEKLKNEAKTQAATAAAEMAKAQAQADYEKVLVEARRDKEKGILAAEQAAQQQVLAAEASAKQTVVNAEAAARQVALQAEAEKNKNVLLATGEREAAENRAKAILALGEAEATAKKLQLGAYAVPGADAFVKIEVSKNMSKAFEGVKGYLPEKMTMNLLTDQYAKGVNILVSGTPDNGGTIQSAK